ncbi:hypothetical protein NL676_013395 [Syzygium grande]|nr:hypothetical protein NL676_013395 [Syzygium grande]
MVTTAVHVLGHPSPTDPRHNKGLAFTEKERDAHYLCGLLPPTVVSQQVQEKKLMKNLRQYQVPLQKYMALMDLEERNERLFYKLLIDNVEELLPIVYTPTVGEACQKYGSIFRRPQGLFISLKEKGKILEVLKNWPERSIQVIVVTDGERILGLGDLGCQGMGIPVGKLSLYTALGGVRPSACLPITIDVGTNNDQLLQNEFYIGLRQKRATGPNYGEKVLVQFEDFANHNAFELLTRYRATHLVFNDDIQGTAAVVLAGVVAALKLLGGTLADHTFLFLGAGEGEGALAIATTNPPPPGRAGVVVGGGSVRVGSGRGLTSPIRPFLGEAVSRGPTKGRNPRQPLAHHRRPFPGAGSFLFSDHLCHQNLFRPIPRRTSTPSSPTTSARSWTSPWPRSHQQQQQSSIRSLAKQYLSFLNRSLSLLPKLLLAPRPDQSRLFESYGLCLDCLESLYSQLARKPYSVHVQRLRYVHCFESCGLYADAASDGFRLLESLRGFDFGGGGGRARGKGGLLPLVVKQASEDRDLRFWWWRWL